MGLGSLSHLCPSVAQESALAAPIQQVSELRAGPGPQPNRAVDMDPRAMRPCEGNDLAIVVEGSCVEVSRLKNYNRRSVRSRREGRSERAGSDALVAVQFKVHDISSSETQ